MLYSFRYVCRVVVQMMSALNVIVLGTWHETALVIAAI